MPSPFRAAIVVGSLCLPGCQGGGPSESLAPGTSGSVSLTRLQADSSAFAQYSGIVAPLQTVVRDASTWNALWQEIHATVTPVPELPQVDFGQEMIIVASLGTRSSGGYDVVLARAEEDASGVEIAVLETSPGPGCVTTQALTQPVDLARAPRRDAPVRFVTLSRVDACS